MRKILSLVLLLAACWAGGLGARAASPPPAEAEGLRALVTAEAEKAGTQAVLMGMWRGDREVLTMALGHSMATVPATTGMHYRIGGITETFQSTLVMMLADQGKIGLDDKISRWLPHLLGADRVTVRMLLANTAGYPDYVRRKDFEDAAVDHPFRTWTPDELIGYAVKDGKLDFPPGTSQAYSHTEYVILGEVLEKATGRSMRDLYQENILEPLGLEDTQYPSNQEIQSPVLHAFSLDRGVYEDATYFNPSWAGATGALTSNLHDLGRWGPIFGSGRLVSPAGFRAMTAPTSVGLGKNRPEAYFAYGFVVSNGWYLQNPNMNGYSGAFAHNPAQGVTLVVAATKNEHPAIDPAAIHILRKLVEVVTPESPLAF